MGVDVDVYGIKASTRVAGRRRLEHHGIDSRLSTPLPLTHRIWREIVRFICLKHLKVGHKFNLNDSKVADFVFLEVVVDHVDS